MSIGFLHDVTSEMGASLHLTMLDLLKRKLKKVHWLTFGSVDEIQVSVSIQMKATEQYFPVILYFKLYNMVLTFDFVDEILRCDHSH